jgi:hypothetical protein
MRSRRFSFLAGWMAVAVLAVAGFAAFGTSGPTGDQVRQEAAEASLGHAAGAYAGLGFVQLGPAGSSLATTSLRAGTAEANPTGDDETQGTAGASSSKAAGTIAAPGTGWLSEVEVRALVSLYFKPADVNRAVRVAWCESRFDPKATDHRTGGVGLFRHLPRYWEDRAASAGFPGAEPTDPEASVAAAAWAIYNDGGWDVFACKG